MGSANVSFKVDIGDTKTRDGDWTNTMPDLLVVHVETLEQVLAFWRTTHLVAVMQTAKGETKIQATLPNFFWEVVMNPNGAPNAKDQLTGDPVRSTDSKPFTGGHWVLGTSSFQEGESSSMSSLTKALVLAAFNFKEDAICMFTTQVKAESSMQCFEPVYRENRTMMVSALKKEVGGVPLPDRGSMQCRAGYCPARPDVQAAPAPVVARHLLAGAVRGLQEDRQCDPVTIRRTRRHDANDESRIPSLQQSRHGRAFHSWQQGQAHGCADYPSGCHCESDRVLRSAL